MAKEKTPEQIREEQRDIAKKTLVDRLDFLDLVGVGRINNNQALYGSNATESAKQVYGELMNSEEFQKIRQQLRDSKNREADTLETYVRPSINDYDIEEQIKLQIKETKEMTPIGTLEEYVKSIAPEGLKDQIPGVPEQLKNYIYKELQIKLQKKAMEKGTNIIDDKLLKEALNEDELSAYLVYNSLDKAYNHLAAKKVEAKSDNYLSNLMEPLKAINEKYEPKGEKTEEGE